VSDYRASDHRSATTFFCACLVSVTLACSVVLADELVYEDGSGNNWRVIDDDPSGAKASIVTDSVRSSDVIELAGAGRSNAFSLGGTQVNNGGWNDTTRDQLSLQLRTSEAYTLYVAVQTRNGFRFLIYEPRDNDRGLIKSKYIYTGAGTATVSGNWEMIERDLAADLEAGEPGNELLSVQGLVVRGDTRIDNVILSSGGGTAGGEETDTKTPTDTDSDTDEASGTTVTYEDGSTNEWIVIDKDPSGATSSVVTDADLLSDVIELSGAGRTNSYRLGGTRASNGGWDDSTRDQLSLKLRTSEAYALYLAVQTRRGFRYLIYEPRNDDRGLIGGSYIYNGVGTATVSAGWRTIERDLAADLQAGDPGNVLLSVQGLVVRGNIRIDDIALTSGDGLTARTNIAPVADAGADLTINLGARATLDASGSSDADGSITGWEWRDDQNALIGTTRTIVWTPRAEGVLSATLNVTDDGGATDSDTVRVTVTDTDTDTDTGNTAPVADAGADQAIELGLSVTLDASGSTDSDGRVTGWEWRDDQNDLIGNTETLNWTPTSAGFLTASLTVTDDDGAIATDTLAVTVTDNTGSEDWRTFGVDRSARIGATLISGSRAHRANLPISRTHWIGGENSSLVPELRALLPTLQAGDAIIVRDGSYELKSDVLQWPATISGTASAPISLLAETVGGVRISGNLEWRLKGQYLHIAGFSFVDTTGPVVLEGNHARFTSNAFKRALVGLGVYASHVEIDNNTWSGTLGLSLWHAQPQVTCGDNCRYYSHNHIHHNTWHDIARTKSNGLEPIMLGYGYAPLPRGYDNATHARIDHNMFSNVRGDAEVISVKSDSNTIEHNCIVDSDKGALVIRMGGNNRLLNNEILGASTTPIRISGESNVVEHNVFETANRHAAGVALHNTERTASKDIYYRYRAAKDNTITENRFIGYHYSARDYPATGQLIEISSNNMIGQNHFEAIDGIEPEVRADRHRSVAEFLRDNRIADNASKGSLKAHDSACLR